MPKLPRFYYIEDGVGFQNEMQEEKRRTFVFPPQTNKDMKRDWKTIKIP